MMGFLDPPNEAQSKAHRKQVNVAGGRWKVTHRPSNRKMTVAAARAEIAADRDPMAAVLTYEAADDSDVEDGLEFTFFAKDHP